MRRVVVPLVLLILTVPVPAHAWGYEAHQFIMDRAIALLPAELRALFEANRAVLVERSIDPDTWQRAGFDAIESPNHFLNIDWEGYGKYPFAQLPRDLAAAIAKFGREQIERNGTLPWRAEEMHGNLRRAFQDYAKQGAFGRYAILQNSAWLAHYVSDAHQPLHSVVNYDGQLTGQRGVHVRWEAFLFERYRDQLNIAPKAIPPILNPRDFVFDRVVEGAQLAPAVLKADQDAIGSRDIYDNQYYTALMKTSRPILERRLNESIAAVAAMIAGAWEAAGKPAFPLNQSAPPQLRRRS